MQHVLKFTSDAVADIRAIPQHLRNVLKKEMAETVAVDPVECSKELHRELAGFRSFTWQEYRIVFRVFQDIRAIAVVGVGIRNSKSSENIYRKLEALARTGELAQGVLFSMRGFSAKT